MDTTQTDDGASRTKYKLHELLNQALTRQNNVSYTPVQDDDLLLGVVSATVLGLIATKVELMRRTEILRIEASLCSDGEERHRLIVEQMKLIVELQATKALYDLALRLELGFEYPAITLRRSSDGLAMVGVVTKADHLRWEQKLEETHQGARSNLEGLGGGEPIKPRGRRGRLSPEDLVISGDDLPPELAELFERMRRGGGHPDGAGHGH